MAPMQTEFFKLIEPYCLKKVSLGWISCCINKQSLMDVPCLTLFEEQIRTDRLDSLLYKYPGTWEPGGTGGRCPPPNF